MKTIVPVQKLKVRGVSILVLATIIVLATSFTSAIGSPASNRRTHPADTILVQKQITSRKYKIKLYPNANHEVLFFSARGNEAKVYQLFLFDVDGRLVKQVNIKNKQTTVLDNIEKGNYVFEVFSDDERIENGQVIIR
jgi:hypothetical protein